MFVNGVPWPGTMALQLLKSHQINRPPFPVAETLAQTQ